MPGCLCNIFFLSISDNSKLIALLANSYWLRWVSISDPAMLVFLGGQRAIQNLCTRTPALSMIGMRLPRSQFPGERESFSGCHATGNYFACVDALSEAGLPHIATCDVKPGILVLVFD